MLKGCQITPERIGVRPPISLDQHVTQSLVIPMGDKSGWASWALKTKYYSCTVL